MSSQENIQKVENLIHDLCEALFDLLDQDPAPLQRQVRIEQHVLTIQICPNEEQKILGSTVVPYSLLQVRGYPKPGAYLRLVDSSEKDPTQGSLYILVGFIPSSDEEKA
jgi:hypothetical protein